MNQKEWKNLSRLPRETRPKGLWIFRNQALDYFFNRKRPKGWVIHHLRDTEEQRNFNDNYYERWGFDFDGNMKYCIPLTVEDHRKYHCLSEETRKKLGQASKGKKRSEISRKNMSIAQLKRFKEKPFSDETREKIRLKNKGKTLSEEIKKRMSIGSMGQTSPNKGKTKETSESIRRMAEKNRIPWSEERKAAYKDKIKFKIRHWWTNGEKSVFKEICPEGFWLGRLRTWSISEDGRRKLSESKKNTIVSQETRNKMRLLALSRSPEYYEKGKESRRLKMFNRHWYNNEKESKFCHKCPDGFILGRLKRN
jgi:hypothetical protein